MIVDTKKIAGFLGSRHILIFLVLSYAGYILIEKAGLFAFGPAFWREILHSPYSKTWSVLFTLNAFFGMISIFTSERGMRKGGYTLFYLSIILMTVSLWTSIYTRFEGRAVRAEKESFSAFPSDYIKETLYMSVRSKFPEVGITIQDLYPEPYPDMKRMKKVTADILYAGRTTNGVLEGKLSSSLSFMSDWTFVKITDFGYAPVFILYDLNENILESRQIYMRLFPPGKEESFEAIFLGYKFYLTLFPDYTESSGKQSTISAFPKNPAYKVKIVRNRDIVYNGILRPTEKLRFDNYVIALPEVKMWAEISFVRDFGLFLLPFAILFLLAGAGFIALRK